jgi:pimeloyl-ACP methyl ester carboxylesterase
MELLKDRLTARAFDLPGHGRAPDWDGRGDYQDQALAQAVAATPDPSVLIGHSFGATVALRLAIEQPSLVRALVLIEPVLFDAAAGTPAYAAHQASFVPFIAALERGDRQTAAQVFLSIWGDGSPWADLSVTTRARLTAQIPLIAAGAPALQGACHGTLAPGALEGLTCPVLLIRGADSPPVIGAIHDRLARRLCKPSLCSVTGAGHMLPLTHPQETAAAIIAFLDRGERGAS